MSDDDLVIETPEGLFCPEGEFHIDPWRTASVRRAVVTHAHTDHLRDGGHRILVAEAGLALARRRAPRATIGGLPYGERRRLGNALVSLHPAGHVLGSAQVRIEVDGRVWVVGGDHKVAPDPTAAPFEAVPCECFVSESTFGLPVYRWREPAETFAEIDAWWAAESAAGRHCVIGAYALGKAQRILASVDASIGPIAAHGSILALAEDYAASGVALPPLLAAADLARTPARGALILAPPSALASPWIRRFGDCATALASGWLRVRGVRRRSGVERAFVLSDHADWPGLLASIEACGCERVIFTHGFTEEMQRFAAAKGLRSGTFRTRFEGESAESASPDAEEAAAWPTGQTSTGEPPARGEPADA
jgi:putative mRNA 3-end processing factor